MQGIKPRTVLLRGGILTLISFLIHAAPFLTSMVTMPLGSESHEGVIGRDYLQFVIEVHRSHEPAFMKRPLTTWGIDALHATGIDEPWAFIILNFAVLFCCGLLVYRLALELGANAREAAASQVIFHLLPTILFAFFIPIYSYDEPIQYLCILAALYWLIGQRSLLFTLALSVAVLAREQHLSFSRHSFCSACIYMVLLAAADCCA